MLMGCRCAGGSGPRATICRSSCSPPSMRSPTGWQGSTLEPMTTSSSRSPWRSFWPGSAPSYAGPLRRIWAGSSPLRTFPSIPKPDSPRGARRGIRTERVMTLRARLSLLVALAVAVAVAAVAGAAYVSATREARGEIDDFLVRRAAVLTPLGGGGNRFPASREMGMGRLGVFDVFGPDSAFQAFDRSGEIVAYLRGGPALPIADEDRTIAGGRGRYSARAGWGDGVHYRMITAPYGDNYALQLARDLTEKDAIVNGLRLRLFGIGGLGVLLAALMGWLVAGRVLKPVEDLT